jgi:hypothetical protein
VLTKDTHVMPWRIDDELTAPGADYILAGLWRGFAIRDGNPHHRPAELTRRRNADIILETLGR